MEANNGNYLIKGSADNSCNPQVKAPSTKIHLPTIRSTIPPLAKKIKGPYSAYNIFFRIERAHYIQTNTGDIDKEVLHAISCMGEDFYDPIEHPRPEKYKDIVMPPYWYSAVHSHGLEKKRKHRKQTGRLRMAELSKMISRIWKKSDPSLVKYCERLAMVGLQIHKQANGLKHQRIVDPVIISQARLSLTKLPAAQHRNKRIDTHRGYVMPSLFEYLQQHPGNVLRDPLFALSQVAAAAPKALETPGKNSTSKNLPLSTTAVMEFPEKIESKTPEMQAGQRKVAAAPKASKTSEGSSSSENPPSRRTDITRPRKIESKTSEILQSQQHNNGLLPSFNGAAWGEGVGHVNNPREGLYAAFMQYSRMMAMRTAEAPKVMQQVRGESMNNGTLGFMKGDQGANGMSKLDVNKANYEEVNRYIRDSTPQSAMLPNLKGGIGPEAIAMKALGMGTGNDSSQTVLSTGAATSMPQLNNQTLMMIAMGMIKPNTGNCNILASMADKVSPQNMMMAMAMNSLPNNAKSNNEAGNLATIQAPMDAKAFAQRAVPSTDAQAAQGQTTLSCPKMDSWTNENLDDDHAVCLFVPSDNKVLDDVHNFPRCHCIQIFVKKDDDSATLGKRGQVGLRCFYCKVSCS